MYCVLYLFGRISKPGSYLTWTGRRIRPTPARPSVVHQDRCVPCYHIVGVVGGDRQIVHQVALVKECTAVTVIFRSPVLPSWSPGFRWAASTHAWRVWFQKGWCGVVCRPLE